MTYQSINPNDGKVLKSFEHRNKACAEVRSGGDILACDAAYAEHAEAFLAPAMQHPKRGENNLDGTDAELPLGGIKYSGCGRGHESGKLGIQEFVSKKLVRSGHFAAPA